MKWGLISDIHSNLAALETVLAEFERAGVEKIICGGDIVGYGPQPNECVAHVRECEMIAVRGNHDSVVIGAADAEEFSMNARRAALWTREAIRPANRQFLAGLPLRQEFDDFTLVHASLRDPMWEYILDRHIAYVNFHLLGTQICFFGHSHIPSLFRWNGGEVLGERVVGDDERWCEPRERYLINPGSVGQPRDGDWRASCAIVSEEGEGVRIAFRRLEYPVEATRQEMQRVGLPPPLYDRLLVGV
jgi:predicted phosphodiesterase